MTLSWLCWYAASTAMGLAILPLVVRHASNLPSRGVTLVRPLGVLVVGFVLWQGTALGWLRNEAGGAALALILVAALTSAATRRRGEGLATPWRRSWRILATRRRLLVAEIVFLVAFAAWTWVRAHDPAVDHTEEPMDLLLLTAVANEPEFPPGDPWLAGQPVSYYYLGYWLQATIGHLAGQPPPIAYNLAQTTWFALLVSTCAGLGFDLLARRRRFDRPALLGGGLAAAAVALCGNPAGIAAAVANWSEPRAEAWWWWAASRVLQDRAPDGSAVELIDEFPFFSYLLGDNHPHVLAMPFVAVAAHLALSQWRLRGRRRGGGWKRWILPLACASSILAINTWDAIAVAGLAAMAFARIPAAAAVWGLARLLGGAALGAWPFWLTAESQIRGLAANSFGFTPWTSWVSMFGLFAIGLALLVRRSGFAGWLALLAAGLVAIPEFVFVRDLFGTRMNTIFKLYYGAWLFFGIAAAVGTAAAFGRGPRLRLAGVLGVVVLALGLAYPIAAVRAKVADLRTPALGLDGLAHVASHRPGEARLAEWLRSHAALRAVVLQSPGDSYRPDQSWLSVATGRPTLLGWQGHELQWRGARFEAATAGRGEAASAIFGGTGDLGAMLRRFGIDYVAWGPREDEIYGRRGAEKIGSSMQLVLESDGWRLWRRRG